MCIRKYTGKPGWKDIVLDDRTVVLTKRERYTSKRAPGCDISPCQVFKDENGCKMELDCDEFPPAASTLEGGGPHWTCISADQNRRGGQFLGAFYRRCALEKGDKFVLRIDDCAKYPVQSELDLGLDRRSGTDGLATETFETALDWLSNSRAGSEDALAVLPLDKVKAGQYGATLSLSDTSNIKELTLYDSSGDSYWSLDGDIPKEVKLQYNVSQDTSDLFIAAIAKKSVSIGANFAATASTIPQASTCSGASGSLAKLDCGNICLSLLILATVSLL
ncbi:hypothetical protein HII31_08815 [Pseudocercospora fuligena]|uniref:Deoxyribonuclease NucA/NucB domain-containing protein n=1 Tax=Pseudocercospora fuligena TaxID=685502 RepID=A0A8H6REN3_9PEZI|nr:hypothetical protein HII31_08815 [Pseudocercospora fuligena]